MKISERVDDFIKEYENYFGMVNEANKLIPKYIKIEGEPRELMVYAIELMIKEIPVKFRKNALISISIVDTYLNDTLLKYSFISNSKSKAPEEISKKYKDGTSVITRRDYWNIEIMCYYYSTNIRTHIKLFDISSLNFRYKLNLGINDYYSYYQDDLKDRKNRLKTHIESYKIPVEDRIYIADYLLDGGVSKDLFNYSKDNIDFTFFLTQSWLLSQTILGLFRKLRYNKVFGLRLFVCKKLLDFALEKNRETKKYADPSESISKFLVAPLMKRLSEI